MQRTTRVLTVALLLAMSLSGVALGPASAVVTQVEGRAYGYFSQITLFGGGPNTTGPTPQVTLPPGGSPNPIT